MLGEVIELCQGRKAEATAGASQTGIAPHVAPHGPSSWANLSVRPSLDLGEDCSPPGHEGRRMRTIATRPFRTERHCWTSRQCHPPLNGSWLFGNCSSPVLFGYSHSPDAAVVDSSL